MRLLEDELTALHAGVTAFDGRIAQVKGWCVTVASGLVAFAITLDQVLLGYCAIAALVGFWLAESHLASIQRVMIRRLQKIESHFDGRPALTALDDTTLALPGLSAGFIDPPEVHSWVGRLGFEARETLAEALSPYRLLFYALVLTGIGVVVAASVAA